MSDWVITSEAPKHQKPASDWVISSSMPQKEQKQEQPLEQKSEFSWPRFLGEHMVKGAFTLPDLASLLLGQNLNAQLASNYEQGGDLHLPSEALKEVGLESQGEGNTPIQRALGKSAQYATGSIMPGAGWVAPAIGAATGVASSGLQELGMNPVVADLLAGLGSVGSSALANMAKKGLSASEAKVLKTLKQQMTPQEYEQTLVNLENQHQYKTMNYQPTTAEVANSPTLSALHRVRQGIPESGLAQRAGEQNEAIQSVFEPMKMNPSSSSEISEALGKELSHRKQVRREATKPLYEAVKKNEEPLNPAHLKAYLKESVEKGDLEKDINYVRKLVKPKNVTKADVVYAKDYKRLSPDVQKTLEKPKSIEPQVNELAGAYKAINSKIKKYARSGEDERKLIMKQAKTALEKDLEKVPVHREAAHKYKELSEPVSAITEHPSLKKVLKTRANEVMPEIFDKHSTDNVKALKNALGKNEEEWNGIREATVDYFHKSISNAQAEGRAQVMSYPKLNNFIKKHEKALEEVFTPEQVNFLDDLKHALHGQNIAKTLGEGPGSATAARTAMNDILKQGVGLRSAQAVTKYTPDPTFGLLKKPLQFMLNRWITNNQTNALKMLDEVLLSPETAKHIMNHEFKNQMEFNKYLNQLIPTTGTTLKREKGEDHE